MQEIPFKLSLLCLKPPTLEEYAVYLAVATKVQSGRGNDRFVNFMANYTHVSDINFMRTVNTIETVLS